MYYITTEVIVDRSIFKTDIHIKFKMMSLCLPIFKSYSDDFLKTGMGMNPWDLKMCKNRQKNLKIS